MYEIIKNIIDSKDYELTDLLHKIDYHFTSGKLTEEQMVELKKLAQENANPQASLDLINKVEELDKRLRALESKEVITEEYPPYEVGKYYYEGDKVTFEGKKYKCILKGQPCVWSPSAYPQGWEEVI